MSSLPLRPQGSVSDTTHSDPPSSSGSAQAVIETPDTSTSQPAGVCHGSTEGSHPRTSSAATPSTAKPPTPEPDPVKNPNLSFGHKNPKAPANSSSTKAGKQKEPPKVQPSTLATQPLPQLRPGPPVRSAADFQAQIEKSAQAHAELANDLLARQMQAQDRQMNAEKSARDSNAELVAVRQQLEQSQAEASELRQMGHSRGRSANSPPQGAGFFSTDGWVHPVFNG